VAVIRRDGRRHAGAGARAGPGEFDRLRHERPGGGRGAAVPRGAAAAWRLESAISAEARAGLASRGPPLDHQHRRLGRLPRHHDRPEDAGPDGGIGSAERWDGGGLVGGGRFSNRWAVHEPVGGSRTAPATSVPGITFGASTGGDTVSPAERFAIRWAVVPWVDGSRSVGGSRTLGRFANRPTTSVSGITFGASPRVDTVTPADRFTIR